MRHYTNDVYLATDDHLIGQLLGEVYAGVQLELFRNIVLVQYFFFLLIKTEPVC